MKRVTPELYDSIAWDAEVRAENKDPHLGLKGLAMDDCQVDTVRLALQWMYGTANFFDEDPMTRMAPCTWSAEALRSTLRSRDGRVIVMNDAWTVDGERWGVPNVINRTEADVLRHRGLRVGVIQAAYAGRNREGDIRVIAHQIDQNGWLSTAPLNGTIRFGPDGRPSGSFGHIYDGGELNPRKAGTGNSYLMRNGPAVIASQQAVYTDAVFVDYWLSIACAVLTSVRNRRYPAETGDDPMDGDDPMALARACVLLAMREVANMAVVLIHEMAHDRRICGAGHCCRDRALGGDCEIDPDSTKLNCGHDLSARLWRTAMRERFAIAAEGSGTNPFASATSTFTSDTVGKGCGCEGTKNPAGRVFGTWGEEAVEHGARLSAGQPSFLGFPVNMPCRGYREQYASTWFGGRGAVADWSLNPGCVKDAPENRTLVNGARVFRSGPEGRRFGLNR